MKIGFKVVGHKRKVHPVLEYPWKEHGYDIVNITSIDDMKDIAIYYQLAYHEEMGTDEFRYAVREKKIIVIHWLGFDVHRTLQGKIRPPIDVKYQFAQTIGNADELLALRIHADVNTVCPAHPEKFKLQPLGDKITVHMPHNGDFYYYDVMKAVAERLPEEQFVFYSCRSELDLPDNAICVPWLDNEADLISILESAKLHIRLAEHDGFPHSVIQHKLMGRHVISNNPFPYTLRCKPHVDKLVRAIKIIPDTEHFEASKFYRQFYTPDNFITRFERGMFD
ncbi:MAG: hypothetical protein ACXABY_17600 [Candidatus Thorarchaeota archaeon]|jgi:hypothetical protein